MKTHLFAKVALLHIQCPPKPKQTCANMNAITIEIGPEKVDTWEVSVPIRYSAALNSCLHGDHEYFVITGSAHHEPAHDVFVFQKDGNVPARELEKGLKIFCNRFGLALSQKDAGLPTKSDESLSRPH